MVTHHCIIPKISTELWLERPLGISGLSWKEGYFQHSIKICISNNFYTNLGSLSQGIKWKQSNERHLPFWSTWSWFWDSTSCDKHIYILQWRKGVFNYPKSHIAVETGIHMNWGALLRTTKSKACWICSLQGPSLYQINSNKNNEAFKIKGAIFISVKQINSDYNPSEPSDTETLWDWKWHVLCILPTVGLKCSRADAANLITEMEEGW